MEMAALGRVFADAAGPTVFSALWQGLALALALELCLRVTPRVAAADRFRAWAAGFAALVVLPFLPSLFSFFHSFLSTDSAGPAGSRVSPVAAPHAWLNLDPRWSLAIACVWVAASLARAIDLAVHTVRLRRLWKRAAPIAGAKSPCSSEGIFATPEAPLSYKAAAKVEICTTRDLDRPSVIGFFAPRILIPDWLLERLTPAELEQVVLHEAEHLRRRDDWINLLQKLCLVVFPLNPALAWMERRLCREREMACDEGVVHRTRAPRAYAACLASLAERRLERQRGLHRRAEALSLGAWQRRPELVDRVHRILRRGPGLHPAAARALLGVVSCGLVLGSVELARCPQLVDFAARPIVAPAGAAINADAMVDGQPVRGFRAIDAVAQVPTRAELAEARMAQGRSSAIAHRARRSPTLATRKTREHGAAAILAQSDGRRGADPAEEVAVKDPGAFSLAAQPQQWIVYTEWEQVESTTSTPAEHQGSGTPRITRQYTMTQLVLRVYPAGAMESGSSKAGGTRSTATKTVPAKDGTVSTPSSIHSLPAAIPIRDGWLVIQL